MDLWGAQQKGKLFEKVFNVKLKFDWQPPSVANGNGKAKPRKPPTTS